MGSAIRNVILSGAKSHYRMVSQKNHWDVFGQKVFYVSPIS